MTAGEQALRAIEKLPRNADFTEITETVKFVAAIEEGIRSAERGQVCTLEEVRQMIPKWIGNSA